MRVLLLLTLAIVLSESVIVTQDYLYYIDGEPYEGFLTYENTSASIPNAAIIVGHDMYGIAQTYFDFAYEAAMEGYVAFGIDMYGQGNRNLTQDEAREMMDEVTSDPVRFRAILGGGYDALVANRVALVDPTAIGFNGYCFGGLMVFESMRMGKDVKGGCSFHGTLERLIPSDDDNSMLPTVNINVLHGADDTGITMMDLAVFVEEVKAYNVDNFNVTVFGATAHGFTKSTSAAYNAVNSQEAHRLCFATHAHSTGLKYSY